MFIRTTLFILSCLPSLLSIDCYCSGCNGAKYCTGEYCYLQRNDYWAWMKTGCLTPREDLWKDKTMPLCEINERNTTLCLCNQGLCNKNDTFPNLLVNISHFRPNNVECIAEDAGSDDILVIPLPPCPPCNSSFCTYSETRKYDEFLDLTKAPFKDAARGCALDTDTSDIFTTDIRETSPQMNSCLHIRWSPSQSELKCFCNTPNCNINIPMYNITRRGKGICYLKTPFTETTRCWGDYCWWTGENNRGCLDASGADENFKLRLGESTFDDIFFTICEGNYCNSDFQYPNGTIVGPSAARRFSSNLAIELSCSLLTFLEITHFLL